MHKRTSLLSLLKRSLTKIPPFPPKNPNGENPGFRPFGIGKRSDFSSSIPRTRWFSSQSSAVLLPDPTTSDGLTVDSIVAKRWPILDEGEGDWKSHAAAIAQSIQLIKKRLQWRKMIARLEQLSVVLNKPDLWDDPVFAGRVSREHGGILGKMKEVNRFEQELLEHIDMLKLAREESDKELESVGSCFRLGSVLSWRKAQGEAICTLIA